MSGNGFLYHSTRLLPVNRRFEYWRSLHNLIDIDVPKGNQRIGFQADLLHYVGEDATRFGHAANDDTVTRFANSNEEFVLFSVTVSGSVGLRTRNGLSRIATSASGLVIIDSTCRLETRSRGHEHIYLTLPRTEVPEQAIAAMKEGACFLQGHGIAGILISHLTQIARENERLSSEAAAAAIRAAKELALASLEFVHSADQAVEANRHDHAVWTAARRFINLHVADANLTAERIAIALNCSRAHLYRVFAEREETIGQVIRAARLERASTLMIANPGWPIDKIAALCGFANASAFSRMFRRQRGISPAMFRDAARSGACGEHVPPSSETEGT